jgi:large subunit ribosomal protein L22
MTDDTTPEAGTEETPATPTEEPTAAADAPEVTPAPEATVAESAEETEPEAKATDTADAPAKPKAKKAAKKDAAAQTPEERAAAEREAAKAARRSGDIESQPVRAVAKYLRFSAQKGRLVVDQIRGKTVLEAATLLRFSERGAAREVFKALRSAVANAENNNGMSADELYVEAAYVDEGPTFKRWKPRARGRADRINKRTCHVTVVVNAAPAELLEGRSGSTRTDRSARVAASKAKGSGNAGPAKKDAASKGSARKDTAQKAPAKKAAPKAESKAPADAATGTATSESEQ